MKKLITPLAVLAATITMSITAYANTSRSFVYTDYTTDNKTLSTDSEISSITLPEDVYDLCVTDDYIYTQNCDLEKETAKIYSYDNNFSNQTLIANIPYYAYDLCYYNNSIYYINPVYEDYSINEICSIDVNTKKVTKHITYSGSIDLYGISNDYMYFVVESYNPQTTRIYRQNINNPLNKSLIYYTSHGYIYDCVLGENKLYLSKNNSIETIDLNTGKIANTYNNSQYVLLEEYNGSLYLAFNNAVYRAVNNNTIELVSENSETADMYTSPNSMAKGKILFTAYDYNASMNYTYQYDIDGDKWTLISSYSYGNESTETDIII